MVGVEVKVRVLGFHCASIFRVPGIDVLREPHKERGDNLFPEMCADWWDA